jgi:hypothetical protein
VTSLLAAAAIAAPAWTWVDADGRRHYSDRPVPGAQKIDLPDSQTFSGRPPTTAGTAGDPNTAATTEGYRQFEIVSPVYGDTLWNIGASLQMQLAIEPAMQSSHRIDVFLDGQRVEIGAPGPQLTVPEVHRGLHTLQAVIYDVRTGRDVMRSGEVNVMVQQTSLLNPNNQNSPRNAPSTRAN